MSTTMKIAPSAQTPPQKQITPPDNRVLFIMSVHILHQTAN